MASPADSAPTALEPQYVHEDDCPHMTVADNQLETPDFFAANNVPIPESNHMASTLFRQSLTKKPFAEIEGMLDCPVPRFWALNPIKIGYVMKQGRVFKSWKRRLCAVEGHYLYYFGEESDKVPKGVLLLDNCVVEEDPTIGREKKGYCFAVTVSRSWNISQLEANNNRTYYFVVNSAQDLNDWIALINSLSSGLPRYATEELW